MPKLNEFLFGSRDKLKQVPTGTPEKKGLHNNVLSNAMGLSEQGGGYDLANQYYNNLLGPNQQQALY